MDIFIVGWNVVAPMTIELPVVPRNYYFTVQAILVGHQTLQLTVGQVQVLMQPVDFTPTYICPRSEWLRLEMVDLLKLSLLIDFFML